MRIEEQIGTDVARVIRDRPMTVFVVDHNGMSLEAFGRIGPPLEDDVISWEDLEIPRSPTPDSSANDRFLGRRRHGRSLFRRCGDGTEIVGIGPGAGSLRLVPERYGIFGNRP
jgi:hypothetical protein